MSGGVLVQPTTLHDYNDRNISSWLEQENDKAIASATDWMNANFVADSGTNIMHPLSEVWHLGQP